MAEEIDFENGRNSNFEGLVTLTLTFNPDIRHIVLKQSSTSTYIPTFIQIEETFCGRTDVRTDVQTDGRTDIFPLYTIRSTFGSRPKDSGSQPSWGPITDSLQSPGTTSYRSSVNTIALNCLAFEKITLFLHFGDRQTNRRTASMH